MSRRFAGVVTRQASALSRAFSAKAGGAKAGAGGAKKAAPEKAAPVHGAGYSVKYEDGGYSYVASKDAKKDENVMGANGYFGPADWVKNVLARGMQKQFGYLSETLTDKFWSTTPKDGMSEKEKDAWVEKKIALQKKHNQDTYYAATKRAAVLAGVGCTTYREYLTRASAELKKYNPEFDEPQLDRWLEKLDEIETKTGVAVPYPFRAPSDFPKEYQTKKMGGTFTKKSPVFEASVMWYSYVTAEAKPAQNARLSAHLTGVKEGMTATQREAVINKNMTKERLEWLLKTGKSVKESEERAAVRKLNNILFNPQGEDELLAKLKA